VRRPLAVLLDEGKKEGKKDSNTLSTTSEGECGGRSKPFMGGGGRGHPFFAGVEEAEKVLFFALRRRKG